MADRIMWFVAEIFHQTRINLLVHVYRCKWYHLIKLCACALVYLVHCNAFSLLAHTQPLREKEWEDAFFVMKVKHLSREHRYIDTSCPPMRKVFIRFDRFLQVKSPVWSQLSILADSRAHVEISFEFVQISDNTYKGCGFISLHRSSLIDFVPIAFACQSNSLFNRCNCRNQYLRLLSRHG